MILRKTLQNSSELLEFLNGTVRVAGADGSGTSGSANFDSATSTFVTSGVEAGDTVFISGEGEFTVDSITSETRIVLSGNLSQTLSDTSFKITYGRRVTDYDTEVKVIERDVESGRWNVLYELDPPSFTVASS
jgi:hypothetical protein